MALIINGTDGVQFNDASLQGAAASPFGLKNRIINGDMVISQRNGTSSVTPTNAAYTLDRWKCFITQTSKFTVQQNAGSVTPPVGFSNYAGITSSSAYSVAAGDYFIFTQLIEGYNTADLAWGTANAKTVTLSFWVRSSLTGTFGGVLKNSAGDRSYPFTYTISTANTWEQKSVTIAGDTSGTWLTTNGTGIEITFGLGVGTTFSGTAGSWSSSAFLSVTGATSVVGTNGATFYITGVQLEVGSTATPFERRMYGTELNLCYRYYQKLGSTVGCASSTTAFTGAVQFMTPMRASPTASVSNRMTITDTNSVDVTQSSSNISIVNGTRVDNFGMNFSLGNMSGLVANRLYISLPTEYQNGVILVSAEL